MIRGCLFDMDGVLLDTERFGMGLLSQIASGRGYAFPTELYYKTLGMSGQQERCLWQSELGPDFPYDAVVRELYASLANNALAGNLPMKPGLADCLASLRARGVRIALATSAVRSVVDIYMEAVPAFHGAFDAVVCGCEVARSKPAPDIYLRAAEKLGLLPAECVGVEDSLNGLKSLAAAGIRSVMIPDLLAYDESFQSVVTWRITTLGELCPLLDSLK